MWKKSFLFLGFLIIVLSCDYSVNETKEDIDLNKSIVLISPNGGENYLDIDTIKIQWDYENVSSFNIFFSKDNGLSWSLIAENVSGKPTYLFKSENITSDKCLIKVSAYSDSSLFDVSDSNFKIDLTIDKSFLEYLQLNEGNIWVNSVSVKNYWDSEVSLYTEKSEYMGLVELNNQFYHKITQTNSLGETNQLYYRVDLTTGYLYKGSNDVFETDMDLEIGNHIINLTEYVLNRPKRWIDVSMETDNLFGENIEILVHNVTDGEMSWGYKFSKEFGIIFNRGRVYMGWHDSTLKGCVINSKVYGDTSTTESGTITPIPCPETPTVTYAGKTYNTVQIGDQCWLKENLNYETENSWCYDNNSANCDTYGRLYTWSAAMNGSTTQGAQGICPDGWHIPTLAEFEELENYVGGRAAKLVRENLPLTGFMKPTNETGFSALFAGSRLIDGSFLLLDRGTNFWSSTNYNSIFAYCMFLFYDDWDVTLNRSEKEEGFSVRCIKN